MKKVIDFLKGVKSQENGKEEWDAIKPSLSAEENELIETVFDLMASIANWAAEQTLCAAGLMLESKTKDDNSLLFKGLSVASKFSINPGLTCKFMRDLGINLSRKKLLSLLAESIQSMAEDDDDEDDGTTHDELISKFNAVDKN